MCYNLKFLLEQALKRANYYQEETDIEYIRKELEQFEELYQVSGFSHPEIIIYTNETPYHPELFIWGLIPHWVKNENDAKSIWNKTLNARGETIFEKPSFRDAAKHKRCLIPVTGFYEHHYYKGKAYPFYISNKEDKPLTLAGLWSEWTNKETGEIVKSCSIVTTKANPMMVKIHNNPKLAESRMPVILPEAFEDEWLKPIVPDLKTQSNNKKC